MATGTNSTTNCITCGTRHIVKEIGYGEPNRVIEKFSYPTKTNQRAKVLRKANLNASIGLKHKVVI